MRPLNNYSQLVSVGPASPAFEPALYATYYNDLFVRFVVDGAAVKSLMVVTTVSADGIIPARTPLVHFDLSLNQNRRVAD